MRFGTDKMRTLTHTSAGARNWVEVDTHDSIETAITELKAQGMQVLVTNLSDTAVDFREIDYTKPTAVILGSEKLALQSKRRNSQTKTSLFQ